MSISLPQLISEFDKGIFNSVYLISGDEMVLVEEARDAIIACAKNKHGYLDREIFYSDDGLESALISMNNGGLFSSKKIGDIRLVSKPKRAEVKQLQQMIDAVQDDMLIFTVPQLKKSELSSAWIRAAEEIGQHIRLWPLNQRELIKWLKNQMQQQGLVAAEEVIAELASRVEGNALAAKQEITKLKLFLGDSTQVDLQTINDVIASSERCNPFNLMEPILEGNCGVVLHTLRCLQQSGSVETTISWLLANQMKILIAAKQAMLDGNSVESILQSHNIWPNKQSPYKRYLAKKDMDFLRLILGQVQHIDRVIKGVGDGDAWRCIEYTSLQLAGRQILRVKEYV